MKRAIAFLLMVFSLTAVSSFAEERGGVGVGNGRSVFKSETGFSVTYADALTLTVHSPSEFGISNEKLVRASEKVSRIEFSATKGKVKNIAEAEVLFRQRNPGKSYRFLSLKGAEGLAHEERAADRLLGIYYLVTSNGDFVEITLEAFAYGNGLELVAPIVHTFTFDLTRPKFHQVEVSPDPWIAGSRQYLRFRVTDDNSGVNSEFTPMATFNLLDEKGEKMNVFISSWGEMKAEGGDWYRVELNVGKFLPPGRYLLASVSAYDKAGNVGSLWAERLSEGYYRGESPSRLPLVVVTVTNSGKVDLEQPEIHELRLAPGPWKAGTWNRVYIRATDDVSGIDPAKTDCRGLEYVPDNGKTEINPPRVCRNPRRESGDWYSIEVLAGEYLRDGDYFVDGIAVYDRAGHGLSLHTAYPYNGSYRTFRKWKEMVWGPVKRVRVRNEGRADVTPPMLHEIRVDSNVWKTGTTQRLYFRATDDLSGVAVGTTTYGYIVPVEKKEERRALYPDRAIHHMGGDWYFTEVHVNAYMEGGEYYLSGLSFHDRAWNNAGVDCWMGDLEPAPCKNKNGPEIPRLHIRIER